MFAESLYLMCSRILYMSKKLQQIHLQNESIQFVQVESLKPSRIGLAKSTEETLERW